MTLNFYTSVAKVLKLKVRKISELIPTFLKVTEKKLVVGGGRSFCSPSGIRLNVSTV